MYAAQYQTPNHSSSWCVVYPKRQQMRFSSKRIAVMIAVNVTLGECDALPNIPAHFVARIALRQPIARCGNICEFRFYHVVGAGESVS